MIHKWFAPMLLVWALAGTAAMAQQKVTDAQRLAEARFGAETCVRFLETRALPLAEVADKGYVRNGSVKTPRKTVVLGKGANGVPEVWNAGEFTFRPAGKRRVGESCTHYTGSASKGESAGMSPAEMNVIRDGCGLWRKRGFAETVTAGRGGRAVLHYRTEGLHIECRGFVTVDWLGRRVAVSMRVWK